MKRLSVCGALICVMAVGCNKGGAASTEADLTQVNAQKVQDDESVDPDVLVEATEEIRLEDLPEIEKGSEITLKHPIYEVRYRPTEDGTTRAWVEVNDLSDAEFDALMENAKQFGDGQVIVPPSAPGIPKEHAGVESYTIASLEDTGNFKANAVGWTYYQGPGSPHVVNVSKPEKQLEEDKYYVAVPGEHKGLELSKADEILFVGDEAVRAGDALKNVSAYLKKHLRPEEIEVMPEQLTLDHLKVYDVQRVLVGEHKYMGFVDIVLDKKDVAADHISAIVLMGKDYQVTGLIEAPAKRIETFSPVGVLSFDEEGQAHLIYESLHYEGTYSYVLTFPKQGKPRLVMLYGDGL